MGKTAASAEEGIDRSPTTNTFPRSHPVHHTQNTEPIYTTWRKRWRTAWPTSPWRRRQQKVRADVPPPILPPSLPSLPSLGLPSYTPTPTNLLQHSRQGEWRQQCQQGHVRRARLCKRGHDGLPQVSGVEGRCGIGHALLLSGEDGREIGTREEGRGQE